MTFFQRSLALLLLLCCLCPLAGAEPEILENQETTLVYPPFLHTPFGIHRATPQLLAWFIGNRTTFQQPQDLACIRLLEDLSTAADEPEFRVSVLGVNSNAGNLIYNPDFTHLEVIGDRSPGPLLKTPMGAAWSSEGIALVADPGQQQVFCWKPQGKWLKPVAALPPPPGGWQQPWGIAFDSQGKAYVTDSGRNQIIIFSREGRFLRTVGPQLSQGLRLESPRSISVVDPEEPWSFYHGNSWYVCDRKGSRLLRMDPAGQIQQIREASQLPSSPKRPSFAWLELDYYENLWVVDSGNGRVCKFNRSLDFLASFGQPGLGDGRFQEPTGLAIHRHFGQVVIAEKQGAHYFWIGTDILDPKAERVQFHKAVQLSFTLSEPSQLSIWAEQPKTQRREIRFQTAWMDSGPRQLALPRFSPWEESEYKLVLQAEATYSSSTYKAKRITLIVPAISQGEQPSVPMK